MKKCLLMALAALFVSLTSCDLINKAAEAVAPPAMDGENTYKGIEEQAAKIDSKWKVYQLYITNTGVDHYCSNELSFVQARMVDADGNVISQIIYPEMGAPEPKSEKVDYNTVVPVELSAAAMLKAINDCKAMIPEGFKFLNLESYSIDQVNKSTGVEKRLEINVQEIGKEQIEANGKKSDVYYQLKFTISPDGKIAMEEN